MWSTANASAMYATPSPIAEIVVDENTSLKSRSASAPSSPLTGLNLLAEARGPGLGDSVGHDQVTGAGVANEVRTTSSHSIAAATAGSQRASTSSSRSRS